MIRIYADTADLAQIETLARDPAINGFTTNPTLMAKAGVHAYEAFARAALSFAGALRTVSLSIFAAEYPEMKKQAKLLASWGANVRVKLPVYDTEGGYTFRLASKLSASGVALNVTGVTTLWQVIKIAEAIGGGHYTPAIISVFAGRIADTGRDPVPMMAAAAEVCRSHSNLALLWASPREILNLYQAEACGCHIITLTPELLAKRKLAGKDLEAYSLETCQMFHRDSAGLRMNG